MPAGRSAAGARRPLVDADEPQQASRLLAGAARSRVDAAGSRSAEREEPARDRALRRRP